MHRSAAILTLLLCLLMLHQQINSLTLHQAPGAGSRPLRSACYWVTCPSDRPGTERLITPLPDARYFYSEKYGWFDRTHFDAGNPAKLIRDVETAVAQNGGTITITQSVRDGLTGHTATYLVSSHLSQKDTIAAALGGAGLLVGAASLKTSLLDAPVARLARDQVVRYAETRRDRGVFRAELAEAPAGYADTPGLLAGLGGSDVILGFLESYGAAAIEDPRYADVVGPRLDALERRVSEAGLHVVSGRLVAPSQGGQSWFAHGSLLSGLWLDNQIRYDLMLGSGRETLIDDFRRAGYRTVALMPAIQLAWPEGVRFGYDEVWARSDIDYAGPPLNWVTMPDQFTWSFLETTIRAREPQRPLFAEVGLISSHAPWTPILDVIDDWSSIGDGSVFARWEGAGEPPQELWLDTERVREHYARSVGYAVDVAASYAARFVDDRTLLIVLGDHQPAPLITGDDAPWDVPVHVISGDPGLLEPFLDWGFVDGAWPPPYDGTTLGVDYFRDWFIRAYSGSPARVTRAGTTPQGGDGGSGGHPDG